MSESTNFPKLKVIYLNERLLKNYLTDLLKIPCTSRRIEIERHAWYLKDFRFIHPLYYIQYYTYRLKTVNINICLRPFFCLTSTCGQFDGLIWLANPRQKVLRHGNRILARVRRPYFPREGARAEIGVCFCRLPFALFPLSCDFPWSSNSSFIATDIYTASYEIRNVCK